jgi:hypothetical protein
MFKYRTCLCKVYSINRSINSIIGLLLHVWYPEGLLLILIGDLKKVLLIECHHYSSLAQSFNFDLPESIIKDSSSLTFISQPDHYEFLSVIPFLLQNLNFLFGYSTYSVSKALKMDNSL